MQIDIITIFPNIFRGPFSESIIGRAVKNKLVNINTIDLREFTTDKHRSVDDTPYGGGPGMLMKPEPLFRAVEHHRRENSCVILTTPQGELFDQEIAKELSTQTHIVLVCGHYEGVDERIRTFVDRELSIGDFVLTNGNLAAMVMVDSIVRLLPGVLGDDNSLQEESFADGLLEYPQYTKPIEFRGMKVPDILLSGNHKLIKKWRMEQAMLKTKERRPDLYKKFLNRTKQENKLEEHK